MIGNDTLSGSVTQFVGNVDPIESRLLLWFQPMLADGDPGSSPNVNAGGYVSLINADVEPTSKFKVKRVKPLAGGRFWIAVKLPNEGTVRVGAERLRLLSSGWKTMSKAIIPTSINFPSISLSTSILSASTIFQIK